MTRKEPLGPVPRFQARGGTRCVLGRTVSWQSRDSFCWHLWSGLRPQEVTSVFSGQLSTLEAVGAQRPLSCRSWGPPFLANISSWGFRPGFWVLLGPPLNQVPMLGAPRAGRDCVPWAGRGLSRTSWSQLPAAFSRGSSAPGCPGPPPKTLCTAGSSGKWQPPPVLCPSEPEGTPGPI